MMMQTTLDFENPASSPVTPRRPLTVAQRFERFVAANPHVVRAIADLARARKRSGQTSWSMRFAFEILREQVDIAGRDAVPGGQRVKLDNSFTRLMTDHIEARCADLVGFFRRR